MSAIHEVAKRAGVSAITVSRVVNNKGNVSEETRHRVEAAIQELNYVPNALGSSLRSKRTQTLALVLPEITGPFFGNIARGVEDTANRLGYHVIMGNSDGSEAKLEEYLFFLTKKQVDGFLIVPASQHVPKTLQQHNIPFVIIDGKVVEDPVDCVRSDSLGGAFQLTKHLLDLGHRHIVVVTGPEHHPNAYERATGVIQAFEAAGLTERPQIYWVDWLKYPVPEITYKYVRQALRSKPRPTALFAATDNLLIASIRAIRDANLRVPEDISVVAFDDLPPSVLVEPYFTVAVQPTYKIGQNAVELLVMQLEDKELHEARNIVLPVEILLRKSTARPASQPEIS
jgi:LacI family transcriptional regulator